MRKIIMYYTRSADPEIGEYEVVTANIYIHISPHATHNRISVSGPIRLENNALYKGDNFVPLLANVNLVRIDTEK